MRNDDYWGEKPKLEKIVILLGMDASTAKLSIERGDIAVFIGRPLSADILDLKANPDIAWQARPTSHFRYLTFNFNVSGPHLDKRVRQAICYAIDPERVWELGFKKAGAVTYSVCNSIIEPYCEPVFEKYKYDPDRVKELLAEAGHPDGFEIGIVYHDVHDPLDNDAALIMKDELSKVDIKLTLHYKELGGENSYNTYDPHSLVPRLP